jgi:hypothetical protein
LQGFQFVSDLHLEFPENREWLKKNPIPAIKSLLWLGGDIVPFSQMHQVPWFWEDLSQKFEAVYWLPGNHEYYYGNAADAFGPTCNELFPRIFWVNQASFSSHGFHFVAATLWTSISPHNKRKVEARLSDFKLIRHGKNIFQVEQMHALHLNDRQFLLQEGAKASLEPRVYLSHHAPSPLLLPKSMTTEPMQQALSVDLGPQLADFHPGLWLYGHTHIPMPPMHCHKLQFCHNQLGYLRHGQGQQFDVTLSFGPECFGHTPNQPQCRY